MICVVLGCTHEGTYRVTFVATVSVIAVRYVCLEHAREGQR